MSPEIYAIAMLAGVLLLVVAGVPLYMALSGLALYFAILGGWAPMVFDQFVFNVYGLMSSEVLPAVPLFIFMGLVLEKSGASDNLFGSIGMAFGKVRGGLAIGTIVIATLFAACTGVIGASVTTMGLLALPPMLKRGYDPRLATGVICAGGTLGVLIPPSIMMILYGPMAGLSVSKLFMGAVLPGLILSLSYIAYVAVLCRLKPELAPLSEVDDAAETGHGKVILDILRYMIPPMFLIVAVLGSIFLGVASPTEAAAVGSFGALIIAAAYKKLSKKNVYDVCLSTMKITGMVMFVALGASLFAGVFMALNGAKAIGDLIVAVPLGKWGIFAIILAAIFVLGMFLDWIGILFIVVPIITPLSLALGFDPLWFAIVVCVTLQTSFLSPPFAYSIFYLKGVAPPEVEVSDIMRGVIPFIILVIVNIVLITIFPGLITWLPGLAG